MAEEQTHSLTEVLDQLESAAHGDAVTVQDVVDKLGRHSFASLMLIFSLISTSPASAIPGITALVGAVVFILVIQMILGRQCLWLPGFISRRRMSTQKLCKGIRWMRKPVAFVERFMKARLTIVLHRPWLYLPLVLVLLLTLFMPFMELVPTSGTLASAVIAFFSAALLTRDGALMVVAFLLLLGLPVAVWHFGVGS